MTRVILRSSFVVAMLVSATRSAAAEPAATATESAKRETAKSYVDIGLTAQKVGDYDTAIAYYNKAYALVPHSLLLFNIAQAHRLAKHWDHAVTYYRKFLASNPAGDEALIARTELERCLAEQARQAAVRAEQARKAEEAKRAARAHKPEQPRDTESASPVPPVAAQVTTAERAAPAKPEDASRAAPPPGEQAGGAGAARNPQVAVQAEPARSPAGSPAAASPAGSPAAASPAGSPAAASPAAASPAGPPAAASPAGSPAAASPAGSPTAAPRLASSAAAPAPASPSAAPPPGTPRRAPATQAAARTTGETERRQAPSDVRESLGPIPTTSDGPEPRRARINIASNPIGWIFGFYGASVSVAISDNLAVRGDGNLFNVNDEAGYEFGASVVVYLMRVYHGPFFEPGFVIREFGRRNTPLNTIYGPGITFGWQIGFDSGFNVAAALGAAYNLGNTIGGEHQEFLGYFRVGYVF